MSWLLIGVLAAIGVANADVSDFLQPISYDLSFNINLDQPGNKFLARNVIQFKTTVRIQLYIFMCEGRRECIYDMTPIHKVFDRI